MKEIVLAIFDDSEHAHMAVSELVSNGIQRSDIGLAMNDVENRMRPQLSGKVDDDVKGDEGAGFGALVGGLTGLAAGLIAITIPGIGPVIAAGPLAAVLGGITGATVGAAAGAITGGITASLVDLGVSEEDAHAYAEAVRRGSALVSVTSEGPQVTQVINILRRHNPADLERRAYQWRKNGWNGFDPKVDPFTAEDIAEERQTYTSENTGEVVADGNYVRRFPTDRY